MSAFADNLMRLRRQHGFSQEQLGEQVDVSRQTVSKWESGQTTPEMDKLIALADLFDISIDELTGRVPMGPKNSSRPAESEKGEAAGNIHEPAPFYMASTRWWYQTVYEYKSERKVLGLPLVHIHFGHGNCRARGIIAIGNSAIGLIAVGFAALGLLSAGLTAVGLLSLGLVCVGAGAFGGVAVGLLVAIGGVAVSAGLTVGGIATGTYAFGKIASGYFASGTTAAGHIAIGPNADGDRIFRTVAEALSQTGEELPGWLRWILKMVS